MNKKMSNILDAAQPAVPTPQHLIKALNEIIEKEKTVAEPDILYGNLYADVETQKEGSKKVQLAAIRAMLEFHEICEIANQSFESLDALFVAFAKFVVNPFIQFKNEATKRV